MDKLPINPGTILLRPMSRVEGGKTRSTQKTSHKLTNEGAGEEIKYDVKIDIPDKEERRIAENLIQRSVNAVRAHSTHTLIGYLAPAEELPEIVKEFAQIKLAAEQFNASAKHSRVSISFAPFEIGSQLATNEECAKALADHVRGELAEMRAKLLAGDVAGVRNVLLRCKRMHTLSVGTQADSIKFGIEEGASALRVLNAAIKKSETPESAGRALHLPMIDAAIETFTYAPENHAPELPADLAGGSPALALPSGAQAQNPVALIAA